MATSEQPFDDREERYFLAEILKDAPVPPTYLLECIQQLGIQPRWNEIALPNGRSVSACQRAFDRLLGRISTGYSAPLQPTESSAAPAKLKKRAHAVAPSTPAHTAPGGFSSFASVNDPGAPHPQPSAAQSPGRQPPKKRGRPSKAEAEMRAAEAAERGEVYPKPKKVKAKPSVEGSAPAAMMYAHGEEGDPVNTGGFSAEDTPAGSAPKRRMPKPKASKEASYSLEATANAANAWGGPGEAQPYSGVPEDQSVAHGLPEDSLLAGLHEHAELAGPSTTESGTSIRPQHQPDQQLQPSPRAETGTYQTPYQQTSAV